MGFEKPTPIQEQAIPVALQKKDLIGCAQTGTGKTAAFILPVLQLLQDVDNAGKISCVVLVPTRELAVQIDQQVQGLGYFTGANSAPIYGGGDGSGWDTQKSALTTGADMIIATPGRLIAHMQMGYVDLSAVKYLILDEADRMLDMGFYDDIMRIITKMPETRQTLMFSATMPPKIRKLAKEVLKDPEEISLAISKPSERIVQGAFLTYEEQKVDLIEHLLKAKPMNSIIIFASRKTTVDKISRALAKLDLNVRGIHSDLDQKERENILRDFKNKKLNVLIATDILARGIDVDNIDLVINYEVPKDAEDYVHRVGRTARAAAKGVAFTFIGEEDQLQFKNIEKLIEMEVMKIKNPAHIGEGPAWNPPERKQGFKKRRKFSKGKKN